MVINYIMSTCRVKYIFTKIKKQFIKLTETIKKYGTKCLYKNNPIW